MQHHPQAKRRTTAAPGRGAAEEIRMNPSHHAATLEASTQLLQLWPATGAAARYAQAAKLNSDPAQVERMRRWVVQADDLDDVYVPSTIVDAILDKFSRPTRFQHFAYCGSLGPLRGGNVTVDKHDGYAWDCDPFLCWYECLANVSCADVKYRPDPNVPAEITEGHPASRIVQGNVDWDDQKYPSALDLADFYGRRTGAERGPAPRQPGRGRLEHDRRAGRALHPGHVR
jgi:hypothetical protein